MSRRKRKPDAVTDALGKQLGKTILRLRQGGKMSLGELSEQSGVAKSMISQIEKNETNPTLATLSRISRALGTSVEAVLAKPNDGETAFVQHAKKQDIPVLLSEDGLCRLSIIGAIETVEFTQVYHFVAEPGGCLESSPHPDGSVENLTLLEGDVQVTVGDESWDVKTGRNFALPGRQSALHPE